MWIQHLTIEALIQLCVENRNCVFANGYVVNLMAKLDRVIALVFPRGKSSFLTAALVRFIIPESNLNGLAEGSVPCACRRTGCRLKWILSSDGCQASDASSGRRQ